MLQYALLFGYASLIFSFISYIPYFRDIFSGKTKPHAFSWFIWGLLTAIAFFAQLAKGAGAGSWMMGLSAVACFTIFVLALVKGERRFSCFDWFSLSGALLGLLFWQLSKNPATAVILVTITDVIGILPTIRKGFYKPYEETMSTWAMGSLKFILALFALQAWNLTTALYPIALILINGTFTIMLIVRRKQLSPPVRHPTN